MSLFSEVISKIKDGMSITFNPFNVHEDDDFLVFNTLMDKTKVTFHTNRVPYWVEFSNDEPIRTSSRKRQHQGRIEKISYLCNPTREVGVLRLTKKPNTHRLAKHPNNPDKTEWDCGHHSIPKQIACSMVYNSTDFQNATLVKIAKTLMHSGIVRIVFEKRNGEIRTAIATTSEGIVGTQTKSGRYLCDESVTPFFDTNLGRWRSFRNERLISVETPTWTKA